MLSVLIGPVGKLVAGTAQPEAVNVRLTPGPVTVQVPSTPEREGMVRVAVVPFFTRVGLADMLAVATPQPTDTCGEQEAFAPVADDTFIVYVPGLGNVREAVAAVPSPVAPSEAVQM